MTPGVPSEDRGFRTDPRERTAAAPAVAARDEADAGADPQQDVTWDRISAAGERISAAGDRAAATLERQAGLLDRVSTADGIHESYRDELTGTLLRSAGRDQLRQAVDRAHRTGEPLVIAFLDVDYLKQVNDAQGHASGDVVLREVGRALRGGLRSYDIVVRYGGDEFVCGLLGSRLPEAERRFSGVSQALRAAISGASISIGLAELQGDEGIDDVIIRADRQMYDRRRRRRKAESGPT